MIRHLLAQGADLEARDRHPQTSLQYVVQGRRHEVKLLKHVAAAKLLLEKGASPVVRDYRGETPLRMCLWHIHVFLSGQGWVRFHRRNHDATEENESEVQAPEEALTELLKAAIAETAVAKIEGT